MLKDFDKFMSQLKETNQTLDFFCDFEKISQNVEDIKLSLCMLNSLIGASDLRKSVETIWNRDKNTFSVMDILIVVRTRDKKKILDSVGNCVPLESMFISVDSVMTFLTETGLDAVLQNQQVKNLVDYVFGIETGLDTNARKNRSGHVMENTVANIFTNAGVPFRQEVYSREWSAITEVLGDDEKPDSEDREEEHYFVESKPKVRKPNIENTKPVNFKITKEATEAKKENIDNEKQDNDKDKYTAPKKHYNNRGVIKIDGKTSILGDDGTLDGREPVSTTINGKFYVYTEHFCNDKETGYTSMGIMLVTSHDYGGRTNKDGEACGPSLASRCSIGMSPLADHNRRTIYSNYAPGSSLIYEATDRDIRQFFDIWINEKDTNPLGESFEFYCRFDFNTKWLDPYKEKFGLKY